MASRSSCISVPWRTVLGDFCLSVKPEQVKLCNRICHCVHADGVQRLIPEHFVCYRGRAEGVSASHYRSVAQDPGPDLHRSSDLAFNELLLLVGRPGLTADLRPIHLVPAVAKAARQIDRFEDEWAPK